MYEASTIIGTCIDCIAPGSLAATLSVIAIGVALAVQSERRKLVPVKAPFTRKIQTPLAGPVSVSVPALATASVQ